MTKTGYAFLVVEKLLGGIFLPCFFFGKLKYLPSIAVTLSTFPLKKSGLGFQNTVTSDNENFLSLQHLSTEIIRAVMGESEFSTAGHLQLVNEERRDGRKTRDNINNVKLEVIVDTLNASDHCPFLRAKQTHYWLTV